MAPKKRSANSEMVAPADSNGTSAASSELRRSTRGGGHKAPEPKPVPKPRSASSGTKKAKKDATADDKNGTPASATEAGVASAVSESADKAAGEGTADGEGQAKRIEVGQTLPTGIVLKNDKDEDVSIDEISREKGAVFFVYPKANTPGCTNQACLFRDAYDQFGPLGYEVYGLSSDSPAAQSSWKSKHSFPYPLLCDPAQILLSLLGAKKGVKQNQRGHYIVEKGGKLVDAKYTISPKESAELALEFIKGHQKTE